MTTATTTSAATTRSRVDGPRDIRIKVITIAPARKKTPIMMITEATLMSGSSRNAATSSSEPKERTTRSSASSTLRRAVAMSASERTSITCR